MHLCWIFKSPRGSQEGSCKQFTLLAFGTVHSGNLVLKRTLLKQIFTVVELQQIDSQSHWRQMRVTPRAALQIQDQIANLKWYHPKQFVETWS